jgi:putative FmdB family regulatory protein
MPLYDYECRNCGHRTEVLHGVNDPGPQACEECGGQMRKLLTPPAIVFKGSGWAKKDARDARPAAKSGAKSSTDGSSPPPSESGSGADTGASPKSAESSDKHVAKGASTGTASD